MVSSSAVWGTAETQLFFELTPERILDAVEAIGLRCTGRCLALNSMENRVYEVEVEADPEAVRKNPSERFRVVKFYRPGRWSKEQILEEHEFLKDLVEYEVPVVAPVIADNGETLYTMPDTGIHYTVFPKAGGRQPDELDDDQLELTGRLLARLHNVGAIRPAKHRLTLSVESHALSNLDYLLSANALPEILRAKYEETVREICKLAEPMFAAAKVHRIHGDCHFGNILWATAGPRLVDFDDMVTGPGVQDIWLLVTGPDTERAQKLDLLLEAYETMRPFDRASIRLIPALRALRMVHFSAWISRRWNDPAFPRAFPAYGTDRYWQEELQVLWEMLTSLRA